MFFSRPTARLIGYTAVKMAHFAAAMLKKIGKSDLAAVGHSLELLAVFPRLRLIPRHLGSATIVWIGDEGCLVLRCARSQRHYECAEQNGNDDCSELKDLCQHKSHCLQVVLG